MNKHKIFISYHHNFDFEYRKKFEKLFSNKFDSYSVKENEIDNIGTEKFRQVIREKHLKESTVTIVLIGEHTWRRKHIDYEIYNTLRGTKNNSRSGLLGIILPIYKNDKTNEIYSPNTIPKRLYLNLKNYASIYNWSNKSNDIEKWIHEAFLKRNNSNPINTMSLMKSNWKGDGWS